MSEAEKPEVQVTTAVNGTGPPENNGGEVVTEKTDDSEDGVKTEAEDEKATHEKKDEDVKIVDAANVKAEEENVEGSSVGEVEPLKVDGKEKETEELKRGQEAEEKGEMAKEKDEEGEEKMKDAKEKCDIAKGKSEEGHEKDKKSEESDEETKERGDATKGESVEGDDAKESETEEKGGETEEKSEEYNEDKAEENEEEKGTRKKRGRAHKVAEKVEGKQKKRSGKNKEVLRTPTPSSADRPVRERKTVERLVEIVEKEQDKGLLIEKGQGTPLKDIPNVAYKLSKKKPADIRSLHLLLFGRKGKAINYKSHIFQFSGFVWHENEDKQRAKLKEKLDKCVKDRLLDFCDVFDIQVSRATARKEDLVVKLLDFMVAPHATTDVILEKEQSRKRKRVSRKSALKRCVGISGRQSRKKRTKGEWTPRSAKSATETEDEDEEENEENGLPDEDEHIKPSESGEEDEYEYGNAEKEDEYSRKERKDTKKTSKKRGSPVTSKSKKVTTPKRAPLPASTKSPDKPHSKRFKTDEAKFLNEEVFSRKKKNAVTPKKKSSSSNSVVKDKKTTGKKVGRRRAKSDRSEESGPTEEELREKISEILKEVDFNTATFTDILKKLASHYNLDLTARKASIKLMIQDELTKLADEADDDEDEDDADKVEDSEPAGKEVEA